MNPACAACRRARGCRLRLLSPVDLRAPLSVAPAHSPSSGSVRSSLKIAPTWSHSSPPCACSLLSVAISTNVQRHESHVCTPCSHYVCVCTHLLSWHAPFEVQRYAWRPSPTRLKPNANRHWIHSSAAQN